jgi:hypothetical protein
MQNPQESLQTPQSGCGARVAWCVIRSRLQDIHIQESSMAIGVGKGGGVVFRGGQVLKISVSRLQQPLEHIVAGW